MSTSKIGQHVRGIANPGDRVTYHDMANQDGKIWEVFSLPGENRDPKHGWTRGYGLLSTDADDGTVRYTDLRQYGWTFAH